MPPSSTSSSDHLRIPPLNGLLAFESVARLGGFSRAAEALSITQSAVSHRISQLESQLDTRLFLRASHGVSLTAQGEALLAHVRNGLACFRSGLAELAVPKQKSIRFSLPPALASNWLVQRLAAFQRLYPDVDLDISVTSRMLDIRAGEADVGLRFGDGSWDGLEAKALIPVVLFPVCSPSYLMAHPWLKTPAELGNATLLRQSIFPWQPWFAAAGLDWAEPKRGPSFSEVSFLIDAAECAQGVALVPDALVERQLESGALLRLFDIGQVSERSYHAVIARNGDPGADARLLVDWLVSTAG